MDPVSKIEVSLINRLISGSSFIAGPLPVISPGRTLSLKYTSCFISEYLSFKTIGNIALSSFPPKIISTYLHFQAPDAFTS